MTKIIPRWEWRTFGSDLQEFLDVFKQYEKTGVKESEETYILSRKSDDNIKIRFELIDMKTLLRHSDDGLEQWTVLGKAGFPVHINDLALIFKAFGIRLPYLEKDEYDFASFMNEIVGDIEDLVPVQVVKKRHIFTVEEAICEYAQVTIDGKPTETVAIEHTDIHLVRSLVAKLDLINLRNVNYIHAMKKSAGIL